MLSGCFRGKGAGQRGESQVLLTMVVDMVSVVMEGVVVRNSFPPGAVPSTWGPEEELLEAGGREKEYRERLQHLPPGQEASPGTKWQAV